MQGDVVQCRRQQHQLTMHIGQQDRLQHASMPITIPILRLRTLRNEVPAGWWLLAQCRRALWRRCCAAVAARKLKAPGVALRHHVEAFQGKPGPADRKKVLLRPPPTMCRGGCKKEPQHCVKIEGRSGANT